MKRSVFCILPFVLTAVPALANDSSALSFFNTQQESAPAPEVEKSTVASISPQEATTAAAKPARGARSTASELHSGTASADVAKIADEMGVPRNLALAVCRVESHCRYGVSGAGGVRGPLQIKHQTARGLGFNGSPAALNGYQGAYYGVKHLAVAYRKCGNALNAAKLHQAGLGASCGRSGYSAKVARFM